MRLRIVAVLALAVTVTACGTVGKPKLAAANPAAAADLLWIDPVDLESRDLFHGPGDPALVPDPSSAFEFVSEDTTGFSKGYEVRDARGTRWSVKLGPEAQTEVTVSRLLWALGYHQPPTYFVATWQLKGGTSAGSQPAARFRPELPDRSVVGEWSWYENDLLHSPAFRQLVVANVLVNNWDWKTSNNKVYEINTPDGPRRELVVRDLGASLGKTAYPKLLGWFRSRNVAQGTRNDIDGYEEQGFIERVTDEGIEFDYGGIDGSLLELVTREDVVRTCELMARLSDTQLLDAFRAGGFAPDIAERYVRKLRSKLAEGLGLRDGGISSAL